MKNQAIYLKVKLKSLAAEARIIREQEARSPYWRSGLREHRVGIVRSEARATLLAYGFLRGRSYQSLEPAAKSKPNWEKVKAMVRKYGVLWDPDQGGYNDWVKAKADQMAAFESWIPVDKPANTVLS